MQSFLKTVWQLSSKAKGMLTCDPEIPLFRHIAKRNEYERLHFIWMSIKIPNWKQPSVCEQYVQCGASMQRNTTQP